MHAAKENAATVPRSSTLNASTRFKAEGIATKSKIFSGIGIKTVVSIKFSVQRVVKQPCRALYTTWTTAFKWLPPTDPSSADLLLVSRLIDFNLFLHFFHYHHQGLQSIYVIISFDGDASECTYQQIPSTFS